MCVTPCDNFVLYFLVTNYNNTSYDRDIPRVKLEVSILCLGKSTFLHKKYPTPFYYSPENVYVKFHDY